MTGLIEIFKLIAPSVAANYIYSYMSNNENRLDSDEIRFIIRDELKRREIFLEFQEMRKLENFTINKIKNEYKLEILFEDNFANNQNNWPTREMSFDNPDYLYAYGIRNNRYKISSLSFSETTEKPCLIWQKIRIPSQYCFSIEVTINLIGGNKKSGFGLIWGMNSKNNYHEFLLSGSGSFYIGTVNNGISKELINWKPIPVINQEFSINHLKIINIEETTYFYINNLKVEQINFHPFYGNDLGFKIYDDQTIEIFNLTIRN